MIISAIDRRTARDPSRDPPVSSIVDNQLKYVFTCNANKGDVKRKCQLGLNNSHYFLFQQSRLSVSLKYTGRRERCQVVRLYVLKPNFKGAEILNSQSLPSALIRWVWSSLFHSKFFFEHAELITSCHIIDSQLKLPGKAFKVFFNELGKATCLLRLRQPGWMAPAGASSSNLRQPERGNIL